MQRKALKRSWSSIILKSYDIPRSDKTILLETRYLQYILGTHFFFYVWATLIPSFMCGTTDYFFSFFSFIFIFLDNTNIEFHVCLVTFFI